MKIELLELLRCPKTGQRLRLENGNSDSQEIEEDWLISADGQQRYPVQRGIPRFVPQSNYADNFGMQWNHFCQTQLDSSGHPISTERFWLATGWKPEQLKDQWVLDAGCGAGRFAEVALLAGAKVVALDYSSAVDACYANLKYHPGLHVVQGDIYALPFAPGELPVCVFDGRTSAHARRGQGVCRPATDSVPGGALVCGFLLEADQDDAACEVSVPPTDEAYGSVQVVPVASALGASFVGGQ